MAGAKSQQKLEMGRAAGGDCAPTSKSLVGGGAADKDCLLTSGRSLIPGEAGGGGQLAVGGMPWRQSYPPRAAPHLLREGRERGDISSPPHPLPPLAREIPGYRTAFTLVYSVQTINKS